MEKLRIWYGEDRDGQLCIDLVPIYDENGEQCPGAGETLYRNIDGLYGEWYITGGIPLTLYQIEDKDLEESKLMESVTQVLEDPELKWQACDIDDYDVINGFLQYCRIDPLPVPPAVVAEALSEYIELYDDEEIARDWMRAKYETLLDGIL